MISGIATQQMAICANDRCAQGVRMKRCRSPAQKADDCCEFNFSVSAIRQSSGNERAFIFRIRWVRCTFTVASAMPISLAICLFRLGSRTVGVLPRQRELQLLEQDYPFGKFVRPFVYLV